MILISTQTLSTSAATIEFTSIPQDATDLVLLISGRSNRAAILDGLQMRFNSSSTGYTYNALIGRGSLSPISEPASGVDAFYDYSIVGNNATSNTFSNAAYYIPNYAGSTNKSLSGDSVMEHNGSEQWLTIDAGLWANTSAITSIRLAPTFGTSFLTGTMASLYKITKGSDGIVTTSP